MKKFELLLGNLKRFKINQNLVLALLVIAFFFLLYATENLFKLTILPQ
jgi:hypothetical protein